MIVAVVTVRVMQVSRAVGVVHDVVDVIAVRHRLVAAARPVDMTVFVAATRLAHFGVRFADRDRVLVDGIAILVV